MRFTHKHSRESAFVHNVLKKKRSMKNCNSGTLVTLNFAAYLLTGKWNSRKNLVSNCNAFILMEKYIDLSTSSLNLVSHCLNRNIFPSLVFFIFIASTTEITELQTVEKILSGRPVDGLESPEEQAAYIITRLKKKSQYN